MVFEEQTPLGSRMTGVGRGRRSQNVGCERGRLLGLGSVPKPSRYLAVFCLCPALDRSGGLSPELSVMWPWTSRLSSLAFSSPGRDVPGVTEDASRLKVRVL